MRGLACAACVQGLALLGAVMLTRVMAKPTWRSLLEKDPGTFAQTCSAVDAPKALEALRSSRAAFAVLLCAWASGRDVATRWPAMMKALVTLTNPYTLAYKKKWLVALAADEALVDAARLAVVSARPVPDELIALLAIDGSEASVDALIPFVDEAVKTRSDALDVLEQLKRFRLEKNAAIAALLQVTERSLGERSEASPALAFARQLGLPPKKGFHFTAWVGSAGASGVPGLQLHLTVDSRKRSWFSVDASRISDMKTTSFDVDSTFDGLKLGRAAPADWPKWLVRAGKKLGVSWSRDVFISSSVRGKAREVIARWLVP